MGRRTGCVRADLPAPQDQKELDEVMRGRTGWEWTALLSLVVVLPAVAAAACAQEPMP